MSYRPPATLSQLAERIDGVREEVASLKRWLIGAVTSIVLAVIVGLVTKAL